MTERGAERTAAEAAPPPRQGRRPGESTAREEILRAARGEFAEKGYPHATIRGIARAAGVNTKLVHYYFGTKQDLFAVSVAEAFRTEGFLEAFGRLGSPDPGASPGTELVRRVLTTLEKTDLGASFLGLVRNIGTHEESRQLFRRVVAGEVIGKLAPQLSGARPEARVALCGSQVLGLVMARYVLQLPPLAELAIEDVAETVGPSLDRYLFADFPWTAE